MKNRIYDFIKGIKVIDTHEHLWDESYRLEHPGDWTSLFFHYGTTVLETAGLTLEEKNELFADTTLHERKWQIFSKYFPYAKNTAYIKSVLIAIKDIYGIDTVDSDSMKELTRLMRGFVKTGFHRRVLRELSNIDYCMVNCFDADSDGNRYPARTWGDTELLRPDIYADSFIYPSDVPLVQKLTGIDCSTLSGWLKAVDKYFENYSAKACSIKIALGYRGHLDFRRGVSFDIAEKLYNERLASKKDDYDYYRPLVDYMFYYIMEKAREYHLPLKFHTGIYAGADNAHLERIKDNVGHLSRIAMENSDVKFVAMHIAYPFHDQLVMALKSMKNLYADMSWAWIVDTAAAADFLRKALTSAPVNKITGFGGDYSLVENTYGHLELARKALAGVLADMTEEGYIGYDEACFIAEHLLRGSAEKLYQR